MNQPAGELILASASPRRADLLRELGYTFTIVPASVPEPDLTGTALSPAEQAEVSSFFKAAVVATQHPDAIVLGADTIAAAEGRVFGKAVDVDHAREILTALAGTTHEVITGVTLLSPHSPNRLITHAVTKVTMHTLSESEMTSYLDSEMWQGKAGAYGIQEHDDPFVARIDGSFSNVVGLPTELIERLFAAICPG